MSVGERRRGASAWGCGAALAVLVLSHSPVFGASATRSSSFAYDPGSGLLTQEVVEPNTPALRLETDTRYDAFGNKVAVTVSGVDIGSRTSTTTYDGKGQFAIGQANALGQSESWIYDARFGLPTSHTGPNGLTTTWSYDVFGRKTLEVRPDGTRTGWSYFYCAGVTGGMVTCPTNSAYVVQAMPYAVDGVTQNGPQINTYYDSLGRVVATESQGFDGSVIRQATQYDAYGRVSMVSKPYFLADGTTPPPPPLKPVINVVYAASDNNGHNLVADAQNAAYANPAWNGQTPSVLNVVVNAGVVLGAPNTGAYALSIPDGVPAGTIINLVNNGTIVGAGGAGADAAIQGTNGGNGGNALYVGSAVNLTNNAAIWGGGGGGGGGSGPWDDGMVVGTAGGGGAGAVPGAGGAGWDQIGSASASPGQAGSLASGGASGGGTPAGQTGAASQMERHAGGGGGGNPGQAGGAGGPPGDGGYGNGIGGAPGFYIVGNGNATWKATGDVRGGVQ